MTNELKLLCETARDNCKERIFSKADIIEQLNNANYDVAYQNYLLGVLSKPNIGYFLLIDGKNGTLEPITHESQIAIFTKM